MRKLKSDATPSFRGEIDTTFQTHQRDMFVNGLVAKIGANAFCVWTVIKAHADFNSGVSYPGIRRIMMLTNLSSATVQKCITTLEEHQLLRVDRGNRNRNSRYIARERIDVRLAGQVICTILIDYKPSKIRDQLRRLKCSLDQNPEEIPDSRIFAEVEILPNPDFRLDIKTGTFKGVVGLDKNSTNKILEVEGKSERSDSIVRVSKSSIQIREQVRLKEIRSSIVSRAV